MNKKLKGILIIVGILVLLALICFCVDYSRVKKQEKPIFCINLATYRDGGTKEYYGLGYKVIDFNRIDGYDEMKIGSWLMKYEEVAEDYIPLQMDPMSTNLTAVVVKVHEKGMTVMDFEDGNRLITVGFTDEGNIGFEQGQEVLIYFDGSVMESYPAQLGNVGKIEIVKEQSDVEIPDSILRFCYSTKDHVQLTQTEVTNQGISLTITDSNALPYNYGHQYTISQKVKNEDYTGIGYWIGENTEKSTAGYTGTGLEYIWKELEPISELSSEETEVEAFSYKMTNTEETVIGRKFDWTSLYGKLEERNLSIHFNGRGFTFNSCRFYN